MTLKLFGLVVTVTKQEKAPVLTVDQTKRQEAVKAIVNTPAFQELKAKAQAARQARQL